MSSDDGSTPPKWDTEAAEKVGPPPMIFFPSQLTQEELDNIVSATTSRVVLTGSAALGEVGPAIGSINIAESEDSYLFQVSLPGVATDEKDFICDIDPEGKVTIKGVTTTGERAVCKNSQVFTMLTQNLCPPGHFSITFQLPGPVNNQCFSRKLCAGMLEGFVKKR